MKIIANQSLSSRKAAGYDSPEIKAVNFNVEAGTTGSVETWGEESMKTVTW